MELGQYQAATLATLFERVDIGESVDVLRFALSSDFAGEFVVVSARLGGRGEHLVVNLPTYSTTVFMALAAGDVGTVARILANLEDYERERSLKLCLGEVVVVPNTSMPSDAPHAVLLLRTASHSDVASVPDCATIAGRHTAFRLAVPLSKQECEFRRDHGHDGLLERFEAEGKCIAFAG